MGTDSIPDDKLLAEAFKYRPVKTKKEFADRKRRLNLMDLEGNVGSQEDYDYKNIR